MRTPKFKTEDDERKFWAIADSVLANQREVPYLPGGAFGAGAALRLMLRFCSAFGALVLFAFAADAFYLGTWKIESAVVAPWWTERTKPDAAEMTALVGKNIVVTPAGISGPRQLACKGPKFEVKDYPADMLFQGMLGEMRERDKTVDPGKVAATLGFHGSNWKTLETGCGNEIDFHFIDAITVTFGLNNFVYTLKKH